MYAFKDAWGRDVTDNWYALAVQPRKESYVKQQLDRLGVRVAHPRYQKVVRHARQTKTVLAPLFPGYLFVELVAQGAKWRKVNWVSGSVGLVRFNEYPAPLSDDFVENFLLLLRNDGVVEFKQDLKTGDRVQAVGGPFDRYIGEVVAMSDDQRVRILMEALNRKIETTLPIKSVIAAV